MREIITVNLGEFGIRLGDQINKRLFHEWQEAKDLTKDSILNKLMMQN